MLLLIPSHARTCTISEKEGISMFALTTHMFHSCEGLWDPPSRKPLIDGRIQDSLRLVLASFNGPFKPPKPTVDSNAQSPYLRTLSERPTSIVVNNQS